MKPHMPHIQLDISNTREGAMDAAATHMARTNVDTTGAPHAHCRAHDHGHNRVRPFPARSLCVLAYDYYPQSNRRRIQIQLQDPGQGEILSNQRMVLIWLMTTANALSTNTSRVRPSRHNHTNQRHAYLLCRLLVRTVRGRPVCLRGRVHVCKEGLQEVRLRFCEVAAK